MHILLAPAKIEAGMFAAESHASRHYIAIVAMACLYVLLGGPSNISRTLSRFKTGPAARGATAHGRAYLSSPGDRAAGGRGSVEKVGVAPEPKRVGPASQNLEYG